MGDRGGLHRNTHTRLSVLVLLLAVSSWVLTSCATPVTAKQTAQVYYDLGNAYARLGEQDKATAAYLNALKLDSTLLQASYNLARVYVDSNNFAKAFNLLNELLAKDPENLTILDTLGYAYYKKGDKEKALQYYEQVLELSPSNENALYNRSMIYSENGKNQEAINGFQTLYSLNSDPSVLLLLGKLELAVNKQDQGIHYLEAFRTAKPNDFAGLKTLADAYKNAKLYDKALSTYDAAIAVKPESPEVLFAKADILLTAIQDEQNGIKALTSALDAGFKNQKEIDGLLSNPELVGKRAVETLLKSRDLLNQTPVQEATSPSPNG